MSLVQFSSTFSSTQSQKHLNSNKPTKTDNVATWTREIHLDSIEVNLQTQLNKTEKLMNKWRMKLSANKTVYTIFNPSKQNMNNRIKLTYKGEELPYDNNPKFLGLTLDPGLRMHTHTLALKKRLAPRLSLLKSIKGRNWGASTKLILITYKSLIRSVVEYAPFVSLITANSNYMKLERIQRKAVRTATYWPIKTPTSTIYESLNIESIKKRAITLTNKYLAKAIQQNILIQSLVIKHNKAPQIFEELFKQGKQTTKV